MSNRTARGQFITFKVLSRRHDGSYIAEPAFHNTEIKGVRVGDLGVTSSPTAFYRPMTVRLLSKEILAKQELRRSLHVSSVKLMNEGVTSADAVVEVARTKAGAFTYTITSPMAIETGSVTDIREIAQKLIRDSGSFFWLSLRNPMVAASPLGAATKVIPVNYTDFNADGSLVKGRPIALRVMASMKGFLCVLMVETGGKVTVLYPNGLPGADPTFVALPSVAYDLTKLARVDISASEPGPTSFVVIVSTIPRPLKAFLPPGVDTSFFEFDGRTLCKPESVGPGWLNLQDTQPSHSAFDSPDTWDASTLILNVVSRYP